FVPTYKKGEKGKYQLVVKKESWENLKRKLKATTRKTMPYSFEMRLHKLKEVWMGWVNNFRLASIHHKLKQLDEWLRNRLRYCIWHDWKKLVDIPEHADPSHPMLEMSRKVSLKADFACHSGGC